MGTGSIRWKQPSYHILSIFKLEMLESLWKIEIFIKPEEMPMFIYN